MYSGPEGPQFGEAARSLFWTGSESPSESASSEVSLRGGGGLKREVKLIKTPNIEIDEDKDLLCSIKFLQGDREIICGGIMASGVRFCTKRAGYCTTAPHTHQKGVYKELQGGEGGVWVFMAKPSPRLPVSDFFQPSLGESRAAQASDFEGLPMKKYPFAKVGGDISSDRSGSKK